MFAPRWNTKLGTVPSHTTTLVDMATSDLGWSIREACCRKWQLYLKRARECLEQDSKPGKKESSRRRFAKSYTPRSVHVFIMVKWNLIGRIVIVQRTLFPDHYTER